MSYYSDCFDYGEPRYYSPYSISEEIDKDDVTDFSFNWSVRLQDDTILTSEFILPDGLTEVSSSLTGLVAQIFVTGGNCGWVYRITNRVTTAGGRQKDWTIAVRVVEQ